MQKITPIEIKTVKSNGFYVHGSWEQRAETPEELARRFLRLIDSLKAIDPIFSLWTCGHDRPRNLEAVRHRYAQEIAADTTLDAKGKPVPGYGYWFGAVTRGTTRDRAFAILCTAGRAVEGILPNSVSLTTSSITDPAPEILSYRIFRAALLAIVDAWEPVEVTATSEQLRNLGDDASIFYRCWIQYLCPWLAAKITPPTTALVERLPNGGLLMSATTETFDVENPQHLAVASDMQTAMAPLEKLPWPSQG